MNTISIPTDEARMAAAVIREVMCSYHFSDFRNIAFCEFCRQEEDSDRNIKHKLDCQGLIVLASIERGLNQPVMGIEHLGELVQQTSISPNDGVSALKWLVTRGSHDMAMREVLRVIRKIKEKMGIPI